ncbi:EAL domain-containing protein [Photobacterium sp. SDRW27]|uniref:EAL domain-containing protein n=1 Tax=Photobacterium obscurum TaxID=2829490 RepID=UPI002243C709|nr:EAL domain-containing protein [Photobacterium obscurum]MCW8327791.1 EAL domain-containing protein [Photobacterium obscurum]
MNTSLWLRWKLPFTLFLLGISLIALSSQPLSSLLFKHDVSVRLDNLYSFYQGRYLKIGTEIDNLVERLSFTCNEDDLAYLRDTIEQSTVIQLVEIQSKEANCSIYGHGISLIKEQDETDSIVDNSYRMNSYKVEPYFNHRMKLSLYMPDTTLIAITEPFQHIFTESETCKDCIAMGLENEGAFIPLYPRDPSQNYQHIGSKKFSSKYIVHIYATDRGIRFTSQSDLFFVQLFLGSIWLSVCLIIGLRRTPNRTLKDLIAQGLKDNEFVPYYQPIINTEKQRVECCEILVRWQKSSGEIIAPNQFIPIAEHNGQIIELTYYLLNYVADQLKELPTTETHFYVSLNVIPKQLEDNDFAEQVFTIMDNFDISPNSIALEVTERTPFTNLKKANAVINRLKHRGIDIKLDDAGTGYGGFSYLQELPIDTLKIDKMFVETIGTDDVKSKILNSIIVFGQNAGLKLIAEGVETQEQVDYLHSKGVYLMQGYFFAKPMPFAELCEFYLSARDPH